MARRYALDGETLFTRFADQFSPFLTLPIGAGDAIKNEGRFNGTVLRLPLRQTASLISGFAPDPICMAVALKTFLSTARSALVFSTTLRHLMVDHWPAADAGEQEGEPVDGGGDALSAGAGGSGGRGGGGRGGAGPIPLYHAMLSSDLTSRQPREELLVNKEWSKSRLLSMFKSFTPPRYRV